MEVVLPWVEVVLLLVEVVQKAVEDRQQVVEEVPGSPWSDFVWVSMDRISLPLSVFP